MATVKADGLLVNDKSIIGQDFAPSSPDSSNSDGGVSIDPINTNFPAVPHDNLPVLSNVCLASVEVHNLGKRARLGVIRAPTDREFKGKKNTKNISKDVLGLGQGILHLESDSVPHYRKVFEEPDTALRDESLLSEDEALDGEHESEYNRAPLRVSTTRQVLQDDGTPRGKPNGAPRYSISEKSNITDMGAKGLQLAYRDGRQKPVLRNEYEMKRPIQDQLLMTRRKVPGHTGHGFFPEEELDALINKRCVVRELTLALAHKLNSEDIQKTAEVICGTGGHLDPVRPAVFKKIFAIIALSHKISAILSFLLDDVADGDLPLSKVPYQDNLPNLFGLARKSEPTVPLECFRNWSNLKIMRFEEWQWSTIAPFFRKGQDKKVDHYILPDQIFLPFTTDSRYDVAEMPGEQQEFEGGYSTVFKVGIHPEHHDFQTTKSSSQRFAIKCLLSKDRAEFKREAETLMKFSDGANPHLITLLATYEQFNRFYLIFHWADADLRDFWMKKNRNPSVDYKNICWVAEQCMGIGDGLLSIHRYESTSSRSHQPNYRDGHPIKKQIYGRHGDIKPQNILWFRDSTDENSRGTLKITDFGLAEFNSSHSKSNKANTTIAASPSYRPPEYDLEDGLIGRSYDIWTLGCLYLEFITWLLGGWDLVDSFFKARDSLDPMWPNCYTDTFFEIVRCRLTNNTLGAMVKPEVTKFIMDLHHHHLCTEYIHAFLNLIQMDMLVIKSPNPKDKARIGCIELYRRLLNLFERCERDRQYASKPAPWDKRKNDKEIVNEAVEADVAKYAAQRLQQTTLRVHHGKTVPRLAPKFPSQPPNEQRILNSNIESV